MRPWLDKWKPMLGEANPLVLQMQGIIGEAMLYLKMDQKEAMLLLNKYAFDCETAQKKVHDIIDKLNIKV